MESPPIQPLRYTVQEYLRLEAGATQRHEYRDGQIIAMSGGSPNHALITMNVGSELRGRLKGKPCRVFSSDLRVRIPRTPLYTYPDLSVICGPVEIDPHDSSGNTATNPRLIVEVLSASTEADDRGEKFRRYLSLETLQEYVLVSQVRPWVEIFTRQADATWRFSTSAGLDASAKLDSLGIAASLAEIFADVVFPPEPQFTGPTRF